MEFTFKLSDQKGKQTVDKNTLSLIKQKLNLTSEVESPKKREKSAKVKIVPIISTKTCPHCDSENKVNLRKGNQFTCTTCGNTF
jgi:transposase-like protein